MKILKHFFVILVLAVAMTAYLCFYKPRDWSGVELVVKFGLNAILWMVLLGVPYTVVAFVFLFVRRQLAAR